MKADISFQFYVHIVHFSACDLLCLGVQVHQPMTKKLTHSVPLALNLSENGINLDGTDTPAHSMDLRTTFLTEMIVTGGSAAIGYEVAKPLVPPQWYRLPQLLDSKQRRSSHIIYPLLPSVLVTGCQTWKKTSPLPTTGHQVDCGGVPSQGEEAGCDLA
jgi:hypothetical protein